MRQAHCDFETRSACDLKLCGADVYSQHPTTEVLCLAYCFDDEPVQLWTPELPPPNELFDHVKNNGIVFGHNIGAFEMLIWNNVMALKYAWPELKIEQCRDTMAMAYAMALPGSLDDASRAAGIAYEKDQKGYRVMLKLAQPKMRYPNGSVTWHSKHENPELYQQLYQYCIQDVEVERALGKKLLPLSDYEQKLWELDYKINRRGVFVDKHAAELAVAMVEIEKDRLNSKIQRLTNNQVATCSSAAQIKAWLESRGVKVPSLAKADVTEMLSKELPDDCSEVLIVRKEAAKTSTAKINAMIHGTSAGGRIRGLFQYSGAGTRRWAGRRVQLQNLPRPELTQETIDQIFDIFHEPCEDLHSKMKRISEHAPVMSAISSCVRGFLKAKPGHTLMACDFSAIEARVIAWLAGQEDILTVFRGDGKIYELTAAGIYGCKVEDITKSDPRRQVGKVAVLALGYQGGVGAMQTMAKAYGITLASTFDSLWSRATTDHKQKTEFVYNLNGHKTDISKEEFYASDLIKQYWREANPKIVEYWSDLNEAAVLAVQNPGAAYSAGTRKTWYKTAGSFLWCKLPSNGVICYPYPKVEMLSAFEGSEKKATLTTMGVDSATHKWMRHKLYGGLLAENNTQSVARDLLADALFRCEAKGYAVVGHVHDEIICEVPKDFGSVDELEHICAEVPSWTKDLPMAAEAWAGERYRK